MFPAREEVKALLAGGTFTKSLYKAHSKHA